MLYITSQARLATVWTPYHKDICVFLLRELCSLPGPTLLSPLTTRSIRSYLLVPWHRTCPPVRHRSPAHPILNFLESRLHLSSAVRHLPTSTSVSISTTVTKILQLIYNVFKEYLFISQISFQIKG